MLWNWQEIIPQNCKFIEEKTFCVFYFCHLRIPFLIVGGLLMMGQRMSDNLDSAFFYGKGQVGWDFWLCLYKTSQMHVKITLCLPINLFLPPTPLSFSLSLQIVCTVVVLGCSILLGGLSLMSLSRGAQEEQNYQALDQNSMTGTTEDVRQPQTENQHSSELEQTYSSLNTGKCIVLVYAWAYIQ